ncbi:MAG TPA: hypothetical protein P5531_01985 [Bacteroidales bacterium]|nr:hypothetical protein [Bacteroidales bacterium]HSA43063.1 hypothetical protein [Bacteroidales bacterium]
MIEKDHIDELFRDRLNGDDPVFKEEYWQGLEKMLDAIPSPPPPSAPSGIGKFLQFLGSGKGIIAMVSVISMTAVTFFAIVNEKEDTNNTGQSSSGQAPDFSPLRDTMEVRKASQAWINLTKENEKIESGPLVLSGSGGSSSARNSNITQAVSVKAGEGTSTKSGREESGKRMQMLRQTEGEPDPDALTAGEIPAAGRRASRSQQDSYTQQQSFNEQPGLTEGLGSSNHPIQESSENKTLDSDLTGTGTAKDTEAGVGDSSGVEKGYKQKEITLVPFTGTMDSVNRPTATLKDSAEPGGRLPGAIPGTERASNGISERRFRFFVSPGVTVYKPLGNVDGFRAPTKAAFHFGTGMEYAINERFSILLEADFLRTNGHKLQRSVSGSSILFYPWVTTTMLENREMNLLFLPLIVRFNYGKHAFGAGPMLGYLLSTSGEITLKDSTPVFTNFSHERAVNYREGLNPLVGGFSLEYSWRFYSKHAILLRYQRYTGKLTDPAQYGELSQSPGGYLQLALQFNIL